ncbi:MAG: response regulator, partial [Rudaea sp.]
MAEADRISVLIVDDHQVVRQGLRTFLDLHAEFSVVAEAADGVEAVEMAGRLKPDIVLMDLVMPRLDGIAATREIKLQSPHTKVIALTSFTEDDKVFPAIQAGASSYLLKDVSPDELVEAIRAVHRGQARLHPDIAQKLMDQVAARPAGPEPPLPEPLADLTERERDVVRLVARGCSNHEIAEQLVISDKTVKTHVSNILSKLHVADRTQLAILAIKH